MLGTNAEEGKEILGQSGLGVVLADDLNQAAAKIKEVAPAE
jgi:succinyl-CoA synthetase beta subunit